MLNKVALVILMTLLMSSSMHRPTDSVRIAIFDATDPDQFLVLTEADDPDNWKLPGGRFEIAGDQVETPAAAAARELAEELGLTPDQINLRAAATLNNHDGVSARYIFAGTARPDQITPTAEIAQSGWFTTATLPDSPNRGHMLEAVAAARRL